MGRPVDIAVNTDRELWREPSIPPGMEYYAPSIHVTEGGGIGIDVGGLVFVKPLREWHRLAMMVDSVPLPSVSGETITMKPPQPARWRAKGMGRPEDIPEDIWAAAWRAFDHEPDASVGSVVEYRVEKVARALLAERLKERAACAQVAANYPFTDAAELHENKAVMMNTAQFITEAIRSRP
jgi:hypothetical protein